MRAVQNVPPGVRVVEVDDPTGDGVEVDVTAVGICASDLQYLRWGSEQIAGHEFAGVTSDGTAVAIEAMFGCAGCAQCDRGNYNLCATTGQNVLGLTVPGGMSEHFVAPARCVVPLPTGLSAADACLVEPASVAWHACRRGAAGPDVRVAVVGAGAIGLLAAASAQAMGAVDVAVEARHPHQHEARERFGAASPTGEYDLVIETGGSETSLARSIELLRPGGTVVTVGVFDDVAYPYHQVLLKEVAVLSAIGYCGSHGDHGRREFAESAQMLADRPELAATLITHRFPLEAAEEAFRVAQDRSQGVFRVVVQP